MTCRSFLKQGVWRNRTAGACWAPSARPPEGAWGRGRAAAMAAPGCPCGDGAGRRGSLRESAVPQAVLMGRGAVVVPHRSHPASSPGK